MISWKTLSTPPKLPEGCVHIWKFNRDSQHHDREALHDLLSSEERNKASKFRFEKDYLTYLVGRGCLRRLLGYYLDRSATSITFKYNEQSKPFINSETDLQFNISHSGTMILMGFVKNYDIGVDIEYNKQPIEIPQIARSFFSLREAEELLSLPDNEQQSAFYNCWTRKEAFIKAKGGGLSIPLDQFEVSLLPDEEPVLKVIRWDQDDVPNWRVRGFKIGKDYTGAAMVRNPSLEYKFLDGGSIKT